MNGDRLDQWTNKFLRYVRSGLPDLTNRQIALVAFDESVGSPPDTEPPCGGAAAAEPPSKSLTGEL